MRGELKISDDGDLLIVNEAGVEELLARLEKEINNERQEIERGEKMLNNPNFINKAPQQKVELEKAKLAKHQENLAALIDKKEKLLK
jgi:valyl-tRNA synthetase